MDKDGVHIHVHGAFFVVHCQVVLPQGHAVGVGVAEQRKGTGSGGLPASWWERGTQGFGDSALWPRGNHLGERSVYPH